MVAGTAVLQTEQGVNIDICRQIRKALIEAYIEILSLAGDFAVIQRRTNRRQDGLCADIIAKVGADPLRSAVGVAGRIDDARLCLSYCGTSGLHLQQKKSAFYKRHANDRHHNKNRRQS